MMTQPLTQTQYNPHTELAVPGLYLRSMWGVPQLYRVRMPGSRKIFQPLTGIDLKGPTQNTDFLSTSSRQGEPGAGPFPVGHAHYYSPAPLACFL